MARGHIGNEVETSCLQFGGGASNTGHGSGEAETSLQPARGGGGGGGGGMVRGGGGGGMMRGGEGEVPTSLLLYSVGLHRNIQPV